METGVKAGRCLPHTGKSSPDYLTAAMFGDALFLLVDDNEDDIRLMRRAFTQGRVINPLQIVRSGEEAIEYLIGKERYANRGEYPLPALVLLDIRMPGLDGLDVLQWIRLQPDLREVSVVMLTCSDDVRDVNKAYQLGADSFLVKPLDFERFAEISQALAGYWAWMDKTPEPQRATEVKGVSDTEIFRREVRAAHSR
jgi:CheY-like chemotaxis protein